MRNNSLRPYVYVLIFYLFVCFVVFGNMFRTYFQQDEWAIFGYYHYWDKAHLSWLERLFTYGQETHFIPLSNIFSYIQFKLFGLHFTLYAITAIVLHALTSFIVFSLSLKLSKNKQIAFFAGLFFLVNASTHQATTWTATTIGTVGSTMLALLSVAFFYRYIQEEKFLSRYLVFSLGLFLISLIFKETSIFLFAFYPLMYWILKKKKKSANIFGLVGILFLFGILYLSTRLFLSQFWTTGAAPPEELTQPSFFVYVIRLVGHPLRMFAQSFVPVPLVLVLSRILVSIAYPRFIADGVLSGRIIESIGSDIVSFVISFVILGGIAYVYESFKDKGADGMGSLVLSAIAFILTSALPFIIIPGMAGYLSLFDGRHLYLTSTFVAILLSILLIHIYKNFKKRIYRICLCLIMIIYFGYHICIIYRDIGTQADFARTRLYILHTISQSYPTLPKKVLFYTVSDKSYYGLPPEVMVMPFQSGFGETLLVWYNAKGEDYASCFFDKKYLYPLLSEEYRECGGRGFGYVRSFEKLQETMKLYHLDASSVIALQWFGNKEQLKDITVNIRRQLSKEK